jgi:hypothetical protein
MPRAGHLRTQKHHGQLEKYFLYKGKGFWIFKNLVCIFFSKEICSYLMNFDMYLLKAK